MEFVRTLAGEHSSPLRVAFRYWVYVNPNRARAIRESPLQGDVFRRSVYAKSNRARAIRESPLHVVRHRLVVQIFRARNPSTADAVPLPLTREAVQFAPTI